MRILCPHCDSICTLPYDAEATRGRCAQCNQAFDLATAERVGLSPGDVLAGFRIEREIGRGGMSAVYRATQLSLGRPVALKVLAPQLARREHFVKRFNQEAATLAQLSHPNIVHILNRGCERDTYYFVMEYVEGESLRARLKRAGRLPLAEARAALDQVAEGVQYAHEQGVLHRDIKPENILLTADGTAKLSDFGIARIVDSEGAARERITSSRSRMGSAHYMAPEQMQDAAAVDHRADVYALGVTLYEALTGQLPIGRFRPASQLADGVPLTVDLVLARALAASPADRYGSVAELRAALERAASVAAPLRIEARAPRRLGRRRSSILPLLAGLGVAALALALAVWLIATRGSRLRTAARTPPPAAAPHTRAAPAPRPTPRQPDPRGAAAAALYRQAARQAASGQWHAALASLDQLQAGYADTRVCRANRRAIARLRREAEAALQPEPPATPPTPEPAPAPATPLDPNTVPRFFHGAVRPLPDGRVELRYDWRHADQLRDWEPFENTKARVAEGEVRFGGGAFEAIAHAVAFDGDVRVAGGWRATGAAGDRRAWCGVGLCWSPRNRYRLMLRDGAQWVDKRGGGRITAASSRLRCAPAQPHTFRFLRQGNALRAWVDGEGCVAASDPELRAGRVDLGSRRTEVGFRDVCIVGRPAPWWLARHPAARRQIDALTLYVEGIDALKPLWRAQQHAQALATAQGWSAEEKFASFKPVAQWLADDARTLGDLWQAAAAGAGKLAPGESIRIGGVAGKFDRFEGGALTVRQGETTFAKKLAGLKESELTGLAAKAREPEPGRDHLALALLELHGDKPDMANARSHLDRAEDAGVDVARHHALLAPRDEEPREPVPARPRQPGKYLTFTGKPLRIDAQDAHALLGAMQVHRDRTAVGGAFVWAPQGRGRDRWADGSSRLVFHVNAVRACFVHLWARVRSPSQNANSFQLAVRPGRVTDGELAVWHLGIHNQWAWEPFDRQAPADRGGRRPTPLRLRAGMNSIIIAARERGTALDEIRITAQ